MSRYRPPLDSPRLAEAFEGLRADYNLAKQSRFRRNRPGVSGTGRSADYHYLSESAYLRMMETARDLYRNDIVVGQGIRRLVDNVVQGGFTPEAATGDDALSDELEARFKEWAEDPDQADVQGENTFHDMELLVPLDVIVDGDLCALPTRDGPVELIEAHRLRTPSNTTRNVVHGVVLDEKRRRVQYWFTRDDVGLSSPVTRVSEVQKYDARDGEGWRQVFHVYRPDRVSQTRGVTAMAPIGDTAGMHDDVQFATLVAKQVTSCYAILHERPLAFGGPAPGQTGERTTEVLSDGSDRILEGVTPGMRIRGAPGEKLTGFSPNIPNPEFFPHATLLLTFIAVNLDMPVQMLLLDPTKTNFSGWRGAIDQAKFAWRRMQRWLCGRFHRPVYMHKARQFAIDDPALGRARDRLGAAYYKHTWHFPGWPYIQPLEDAQADAMRLRTGQISPRRLHAERGREWEEVAGEIVVDNALAIRLAKAAAAKINSEFPAGEAVHWRDLLCLPTPERVTESIALSQQTRQLAEAAQGATQNGY